MLSKLEVKTMHSHRNLNLESAHVHYTWNCITPDKERTVWTLAHVYTWHQDRLSLKAVLKLMFLLINTLSSCRDCWISKKHCLPINEMCTFAWTSFQISCWGRVRLCVGYGSNGNLNQTLVRTEQYKIRHCHKSHIDMMTEVTQTLYGMKYKGNIITNMDLIFQQF